MRRLPRRPTRGGPLLAALLVVAASLVVLGPRPTAGAAGGGFAATGPTLQLGDRGPAVVAVQRRLWSLHFWDGPADGVFGDATQQAVFALQKAARLAPDGVVGPSTRRALARGVTAPFRPSRGRVVEVDLERELLLIVRGDALVAAFNTSTGGGYTYDVGGVSGLAETPRGVFHLYREVDGLDVSPLGELWRPKYFDGGFAIHGDAYVPATPVSHGCVRISNEAIDWVWASDQMPLGTEVWIF